MATQNSNTVQIGNRLRNTSTGATTYLLAVVAFFALVPPVIALGRDYNPFLYGAAMRLGVAAPVLALLVALYWRVLRNKEIYGFIRRRFFSQGIGEVLISYFDSAVLRLAFRWRRVLRAFPTAPHFPSGQVNQWRASQHPQNDTPDAVHCLDRGRLCACQPYQWVCGTGQVDPGGVSFQSVRWVGPGPDSSLYHGICGI